MCYLLGEHHLTSTASAPSDQGFGQPSSYWWWFNRQKVFHAWDYLDNQVSTGQLSYSQPHIAVVDTGFDVSSSALDKPFYTSGESVKYDPYSSNPWTIDTNVQQLAMDSPGATASHGAFVASVAASPRNNSTPSSLSLAGIAPQATIIPYKLVSYCKNPSTGCAPIPGNYTIHEQTIAHGIFRASHSNADAINVSMQMSGRPITHSPAITNEILSAANTRSKVVVIIAGNGDPLTGAGYDLDDPVPVSPPYSSVPLYCNCIVVGGSEYESAAHAKRWAGSNYNRVHLAAGAKDISGATFNPMNNLRFMATRSGTSLAAPMVAATAGLMKKVAEGAGNYSLTPAKIRNLITYSATASRFSANSAPTTSETKYLGEDLNYYLKNPYFMVGMRELNVYNAIIMAQFSHQYPALTRIHNIDDFAWIGFNNSWTDPNLQKGFGMDAIFGVQSILSGDIINFATYNSGTSYNAIAHGYQVYKDGLNIYDWMGGVAYITGAQNNAAVANNTWHQLQAFNFY